MKFNTIKTKRTLLFISLVVVCAVLPMVGGLAQSIAQGYLTNDPLLKNGMAVQISLEEGVPNPDTVERAYFDNPERIIGVTAPAGDSFAVIGSSQDQVFVKSRGQVEAFVSDLGGPVNKGDVLTISRIRGVFMRASDKSTEIATAVTGFDVVDPEEYSVDAQDGSQSTKIYKLLISLDRQASQGSPNDSGTLSRVSRALVGKDVGELRVIIALIVFALLLVIVGGIVYGSVSSSLTSMGRNPLAKGIIKKEMIRVIIMALLILLAGLGVVYAILWV